MVSKTLSLQSLSKKAAVLNNNLNFLAITESWFSLWGRWDCFKGFEEEMEVSLFLTRFSSYVFWVPSRGINSCNILLLVVNRPSSINEFLDDFGCLFELLPTYPGIVLPVEVCCLLCERCVLWVEEMICISSENIESLNINMLFTPPST